MPTANADRNLLFGILALQMDFISRDALIQAMNAWVLDKSKSLAQILSSHQALSSERGLLLDALVAEHLKIHNDAPAKSLASVSTVPGLREQLQSLADSELDESLARLSTPRAEGRDPHLTRDFSFGGAALPGARYRVLRPHARGGLGEVFVAQDQELHREVALKEIQARHADDPSSRARFLLEAEITGGLEHPGVVPVYGLGLYPDGRPFYAMRFIKGDSLKEAIARFHQNASGKAGERSLELRKLLGRFLDVCNAMAYAHSRGVLHRDLKPANIMLGDFGETLVVDWGLAKALGKEEIDAGATYPRLVPSTGSSAPTQMGEVLGTPAYMSPEQAEGRLDQMGPSSDVYSLGATLYHLLTGQAPIKDADRGELLRRVQKGDFPSPRALDKSIDPPLEAICLKAMAVRPEDRYSVPRDLADDLEHWLADEPVSAWPEPWTVKSRRWINRHRTSVAGAAAAVVVAAASLAGATYFLSRANHDLDVANQKERLATEEAIAQKERATESYRLARQGLEAAVAIKDDERLKSGKLEDLKRKLAQAEANFYEKFVALHGNEPEFRFERAMAYSKLGVATVILGDREEAIRHLETAAEILEQLKEEFPDNLVYQDELQQHLNDVGFYYQELKRLAKAEEILQKASAQQQELSRSRPHDNQLGFHRAMTLTNLGMIYRDTRRLDKAEKAFKDALAIIADVTKNCTKDGEGGRYWSCLANVHTHLGYLYSLMGRDQQVIPERRQGIDIWNEVVKANPKEMKFQIDLSTGYHYLGMTYQFRSEWSLAEQNYLAALALREPLVERHPALAELKSELADTYFQLAWVYQNTGRKEKALAEYPKIISVCKALSSEYPNDPKFKSKLALAYNDWGIFADGIKNYPEAEQAHSKCLAISRTLVKDYPGIADYQAALAESLNNLAGLFMATNRNELSEEHYKESVRILEDLHSKYPLVAKYIADKADTLYNLGLLFANLYRFQEALDCYALALQEFLVVADKDPKNLTYQNHIAIVYKELANAHDGLSQNDEASAAQEKAIAYWEKSVNGASSPTEWAINLGELYTTMGFYVGQGKTPEEALKWHAKAIAHLTALAAAKESQKEVDKALAAAYAGRAFVESKPLSRHEDALHSFDEALKVCPEKDNAWIRLHRAYAVARKGDYVDAAKTADESAKQPSATAMTLRNAACVFALCSAAAQKDAKLLEADRHQLADQYATQAMQLMIKARDAGYFKNLAKNDRRITDKDLDGIRERNDFKEFVKLLGP